MLGWLLLVLGHQQMSPAFPTLQPWIFYLITLHFSLCCICYHPKQSCLFKYLFWVFLFSIYFSTWNNIGALLVSLTGESLIVSDTRQVLNKYLLTKQMEVAVNNHPAWFPGWLRESNKGFMVRTFCHAGLCVRSWISLPRAIWTGIRALGGVTDTVTTD